MIKRAITKLNNHVYGSDFLHKLGWDKRKYYFDINWYKLL